MTRCLASALSPGTVHLITFLAPAVWFPGCAAGVPCVSSGELISGSDLPLRCQPSRTQEDLVSNWEPAHSLVEDAISGAEIAPHILGLAVAHLPPCLQQGRAARARGGQSRPQRGILYQLQAGFIANQDFWDSGWLTSTRRIAARGKLPKGDTQHT